MNSTPRAGKSGFPPCRTASQHALPSEPHWQTQMWHKALSGSVVLFVEERTRNEGRAAPGWESVSMCQPRRPHGSPHSTPGQPHLLSPESVPGLVRVPLCFSHSHSCAVSPHYSEKPTPRFAAYTSPWNSRPAHHTCTPQGSPEKQMCP